MDIFISWSGERSKALAEALRIWLPKVIQNLNPWISVSDIEKGARWLKDISGNLEKTNFGLFCLTPENINEPWILFEAGAISKTLDSAYVCPILYKLEPASLTGPMAQFQATKLHKDDMFRLLQSINKCLDNKMLTDNQLEESFEMWWPKLEIEINKIPSSIGLNNPERTDRELLEEVLNTVRNLSGQSSLYNETSKVLSTLSPREEKILRMLFGVGESRKYTLEEIASDFEMPVELIGEIKERALRKMRHHPSRAKVLKAMLSELNEDA